MKKFVFAWITIIIGLLGVLYLIGMQVSKETEEYSKYEADIVESSKIYLELSKVEFKIGQKKNIPIKELISNNYLMEFDKKTDKCDGYVEIYRSISDYSYKPYIKCKNYETDGYTE